MNVVFELPHSRTLPHFDIVNDFRVYIYISSLRIRLVFYPVWLYVIFIQLNSSVNSNYNFYSRYWKLRFKGGPYISGNPSAH